MVTASIIVTSYNQKPVLELLFASLERQTLQDFEVIIADDGSSDGTAELCQQKRSFPLIFVTQPDEGYRKSKIVNEAIRRSSADYLIFIDGDVILERHFVEDHVKLRQPGGFICGRRVDLGPKVTERVNVAAVRRGQLDRISFELLRSAMGGDTVGLKRGLRIPFAPVRTLMGYDRPIDLLGSNMSMWKADILAVNGFNEGLEAYWGEDGDLFVRLRNLGRAAINAKGLCVQFHVFHKRRAPTQANVDWYARMLQDTTYVWAEKGLVKR